MHLAELYGTVGETGHIHFIMCILLFATSYYTCSLGSQFQEESVWVKYSAEHI